MDRNITVIAAAGNGRNDSQDPFRSVKYDSCKVHPASYPGVITVGSTNVHDYALMGIFDNRTLITNMGRCLDVFAPGYKILSSYVCPVARCKNNNSEDDDGRECIAEKICNNSCRRSKSGTSQSAPLVAGGIALLLEKCPNLTNDEVKSILKHSLSVNKVIFYKALLFSANISETIDNSVLATISDTIDRLFYIGNDLGNINCSVHNMTLSL